MNAASCLNLSPKSCRKRGIRFSRKPFVKCSTPFQWDKQSERSERTLRETTNRWDPTISLRHDDSVACLLRGDSRRLLGKLREGKIHKCARFRTACWPTLCQP